MDWLNPELKANADIEDNIKDVKVPSRHVAE